MPPRRMAWNTQRFQSQLTTGVTQVTDLLANLVDLDTLTAIRMVGRLFFGSTSVSATDAGQILLDMGVGVTSLEAFDAPTVPDPNVDADVPTVGWLWRDSLLLQRENTSGSVEFNTEPETQFDIWAARKVDRGKLFLATHVTLIGGSFGATRMVGIIRVLCKT